MSTVTHIAALLPTSPHLFILSLPLYLLWLSSPPILRSVNQQLVMESEREKRRATWLNHQDFLNSFQGYARKANIEEYGYRTVCLRLLDMFDSLSPSRHQTTALNPKLVQGLNIVHRAIDLSMDNNETFFKRLTQAELRPYLELSGNPKTAFLDDFWPEYVPSQKCELINEWY